jgi:hypothetical protein
MTPRQKLAAVFAVPSHTWQDAPAVVADYLKLVSRFGMEETLRTWAEEYVRHHAGRCLWDAEFLTSNYQFINCINVGGAPFIFEYLIKQKLQHLDLLSLDIDPSRFPHVEDTLGITVVNIDIESPESSNSSLLNRFQCIVFCEIFEHLRIDLLGTMYFLKTLLATDGFLYLTMPNGIGKLALHRWMRGRTGPDPVSEWIKLRDLGHMGHVREYSYAEAHDVLVHSGFHVEKYVYRNKRGSLSDRVLTRAVPILSDEIVIVARKAT